MSLITEQVKELREEADFIIETLDKQFPTTIGVAKIMKRAADTIEQLAAKVRNENGFIFPENPTNGDMLKAMFPDEEFTVKDYYQGERSIVVICNKDNSMEFEPIWWRSPYKRGDTE